MLRFLFFMIILDVSYLLSAPSLSLLRGDYNLKKSNFFVQVPKKYTVSDRVLYVQKETFQGFEKLVNAASKQNISLFILSGVRTFSYQKRIWERKYKYWIDLMEPQEAVKKVLEYSAFPGTSRHHWGTDIDIAFRKDGKGMLNNKTFSTGFGKTVYTWLQKNAMEYGFCQPYQKKELHKNAYSEERWHWSYHSVAKKYLDSYIKNIEKLALQDILGSKYLFGSSKDYIQNIHKSCR